MTFLTLLSNSILPAAITPLFTVFIPVVMGWILGFIPAEQKKPSGEHR
ncbi:hypothetical protein AM1_2820 [Acaryochloris marina MBIC11017]|uniref:Uncharacterized protein n=1 Tax=Acaryochloris marina (strain MBIC 11017) TaxID=329726 RepID=B0C9D9_ACAM1|nr:hypothetical protein AM1_2820 [Acaryochloris marina MBIC11017]